MTLRISFVVDTFYTCKKFASGYSETFWKISDFEVVKDDINIK